MSSIPRLAPLRSTTTSSSNNVKVVTSTSVSKASTAKVIPGLKRALLIGINYVNTPYSLYGCINDAKNMSSHLRKYFPSCTNHKLLTDETVLKPNRKNILEAITWLVTGLQPGENVFFHYSGHGGLIRDTNGDEVSGYDSCIYPCDGQNIETISDDELRAFLANRIPVGCKCFVVLDCCHSGSAVDLRCKLQVPSQNSIYFEELVKYSKTSGQVIFLSGCHDVQEAADTVAPDGKPCGALTWALIETWKKYGAVLKLKYVLWDVLVFLKQRGYTQVPQLSLGQYIDFNTVFDLSSGA
jgi:hypothetical protein